jgi:hypothetical protein
MTPDDLRRKPLLTVIEAASLIGRAADGRRMQSFITWLRARENPNAAPGNELFLPTPLGKHARKYMIRTVELLKLIGSHPEYSLDDRVERHGRKLDGYEKELKMLTKRVQELENERRATR